MLLSACIRTRRDIPCTLEIVERATISMYPICSAESAQSSSMKAGRDPPISALCSIDTQLALVIVRRQTLELSSSRQGRNLVLCQSVPSVHYPRRNEYSPLVSFRSFCSAEIVEQCEIRASASQQQRDGRDASRRGRSWACPRAVNGTCGVKESFE